MNQYFKGEKSIALESETFLVKILPKRGAKIASILYKPLKIELLSQIEAPVYSSTANPENGFTAEDSSGFDDMFPSILSEEYVWESGEQTRIEDHGNVWYEKWSTQQWKENECYCSLEVSRFSVLLEKLVRVKEGSIHISYALTNNSNEAFRGLWAAHALFAMRQGMRISIDKKEIGIINAMEESQLGQKNFGQRLTFEALSNEWQKIASFNPSSHSCAKFYFVDPTISRCSLIDDENRFIIHIDYDPEKSPYLGIWKNEGGWAGQYNLGIEPATSAMDCPSLAHKFGMQRTFPPNETTVWDFKITVDSLEI